MASGGTSTGTGTSAGTGDGGRGCAGPTQLTNYLHPRSSCLTGLLCTVPEAVHPINHPDVILVGWRDCELELIDGERRRRVWVMELQRAHGQGEAQHVSDER